LKTPVSNPAEFNLDDNQSSPNVNPVNLDEARFASSIEPAAHAASMVNPTSAKPTASSSRQKPVK